MIWNRARQVRSEDGATPLATSTAEPADNFDEASYLAANPDVAAAVRAGRERSGHHHWLKHGRAEGRTPPPGYTEGEAFDADWYAASYHAARLDIAAGRARDAAEHYAARGRARGYLANRFAARPPDPAGIASRFGGLWLDHANAADLIDGKCEIGRITPAQAALLHDWRRDGYVVLRNAIQGDILDRAAATLAEAYAGDLPGALFECPSVGGYHPIPWRAEVRERPAKALDLHWLSPDIRALIFAPAVREMLELLFERRALATQTLTFLHGSTQGYHQDTLYVPYTLPTQFAASWIALEDVQDGGGELTYFPGSHRLPEMLFGGEYKTLWDAQRMLRRNTLREETADYSDRLAGRSRDAGLTAERFKAKRGDVLLWHADLAHGGLPITGTQTRASVVTHYCPRELAPLSFERGRTAMCDHDGVAWHATGYYSDRSG